jgi:hypothetical protein
MEEKMNQYYEKIQRDPNRDAVIGKAKKSLDNTEFKLLDLVSRMRGQFSKEGVPMITSSTQTMDEIKNKNGQQKVEYLGESKFS